MGRRASSLSNVSGSGIAREIGSKYDVIKEVSNYLGDIEVIADSIDSILESTTRADLALGRKDIVNMLYTNGDLTTVIYEGDDGSTIYYREILNYTNGNLALIEHYNGTADLVTPTATTILTYDSSDNLVAANYTED